MIVSWFVGETPGKTHHRWMEHGLILCDCIKDVCTGALEDFINSLSVRVHLRMFAFCFVLESFPTFWCLLKHFTELLRGNKSQFFSPLLTTRVSFLIPVFQPPSCFSHMSSAGAAEKWAKWPALSLSASPASTPALQSSASINLTRRRNNPEEPTS